MTFSPESVSKVLLRFGAVVVVAAGASACSSVPGWVDPTTWIGGDDSQASAPPDGNDQTADNGQATTADNSQTPDLSTIPDKPAAPSTADEQKNVADSLAADRSRAQYSSDALKGGTEPAAAPPPAAPPPSTEDLASDNSSTNAAPSEETKPASQALPPGAAPGTLPNTDNSTPAGQQVASVQTPPPAAASNAAVPAVPAVSAQTAMAATDSALGFKPSSAPPLDATVAQFVPQPILARYEQTAAIGPAPAVPTTTPINTEELASAPMASPRHGRRRAAYGVGGPEAMSGAVVANFDALQAASTAPSFASSDGAAAVVFFPHDTTVLSASAKAQVRAAAKNYLAMGGQGYVRIVGHSSSRTANMTQERHLVWNFEHSQARANAVARELIRDGVPASKVLIEAVGDTEPVYFESMPQGEDGNRRAEIFFQG